MDQVQCLHSFHYLIKLNVLLHCRETSSWLAFETIKMRKLMWYWSKAFWLCSCCCYVISVCVRLRCSSPHCLIGSVSHALSGTWLMKPVTSSSIRSCPKTVSTVLIKACSKKLSIAWSDVVSNTGCLTCLCCAAVRVNETDTFADEEGLNDEYFDFEDISGMVLIAGSAHPCCWVRAHFLTSCVLLQRSSPTMIYTSCIASEE